MKRRTEAERRMPNAYLYIRAAAINVSYDDMHNLERTLLNICCIGGYYHIGTLLSIGGKNHGIEILRKDIEYGHFKDADVIFAIAHESEKNSKAFSQAQKLLRQNNIYVPIIVIGEGQKNER